MKTSRLQVGLYTKMPVQCCSHQVARSKHRNFCGHEDAGKREWLPRYIGVHLPPSRASIGDTDREYNALQGTATESS